jgi:hypothetical protein
MNLIENTPIVLDNDNADVINAAVYQTLDLRSYKVVINYPVASRITDEYSNGDIEYFWSQQYPEWDKKIYGHFVGL